MNQSSFNNSKINLNHQHCGNLNNSLPNTIITINHIDGKEVETHCKKKNETCQIKLCDNCFNNNCLKCSEKSIFNKKTNSCECIKGYDLINNKCESKFFI